MGCTLLAYVVVYYVVCLLLPEDSLLLTAISDGEFVLFELGVLILCVMAVAWTKEKNGRAIWSLVALWLLFNLAGDFTWGYYEMTAGAEGVPFAADVFYLAAYVPAFAAVLVSASNASTRLRAAETALDAAMLTIGAAALSWPFLVGPLLEVSGLGRDYWADLAYPIADLAILFAFVSFLLGSVGQSQSRTRPYLVLLALAFFVQIVADGAYWMHVVADAEYTPGSWMDPIWLVSFGLAGFAASVEIYGAKRSAVVVASASKRASPREQRSFSSGLWRTLIPYVGLPVVAGVLIAQLNAADWAWSLDTQILAYLGFVLVGFLVARQYLTLLINRRLNLDLQHTSSQLVDKVDTLADLNRRLENLNNQAHHLNSLRDFHEVATRGLDLACSFARCPAGWITAKDEEGGEAVVATRGPVEQHHPGAPKLNAVGVAKGVLRALPLEVRGESLGTIWLVRPASDAQDADLLPVISTHVATALDNTRRYEEAVHLAERDALTGLYNHRGIHRRLAGEALRAQQNGTELSLIMMDLDDFKALNDTFGHPAGDSVLRQVSDAVRSVLRHADLAGRVGGDELLIVLPNTGTEGALQLCERLRNAILIRPYVTSDGRSTAVRFSLGVATYPQDAQSLGQLIETADAHLYTSKQRGGNATTRTTPAEREADEVDAGGVLGVTGRLLSVVGARDHYTRRHSEHVALYALSLGEAAGLSDASLNTLHIAAMLHDVGKIGVPTDLLQKPGLLSPEEEDMVRRHVDISTAIITDIPRLAEVAQAVSAHHERHDGSGYPAEISGDDIPLLGRILAIADAYSAMTLDRPYRGSLSRDQARDELLRAAGTQFDPVLVHKFVEILDVQGSDSEDSRAEAG